MARPRNTAQRQKQIARGLIQVMAEHGYEGASVAAIAQAAGLTAGVIHYHFKTKLEILLFALEELVSDHRQRLEARLAESSSAWSGVEAFIDHHVGLGSSADPVALACWIVLGAEAVKQPAVGLAYGRALAELNQQLLAIIEAGNEQESLHCSAPDEAAAAILASIQGSFMLAATTAKLIPKGSAARSIQTMARALLQPNERTRAGTSKEDA